MKLKDLHPPILELAPGQTFHRVQLTRARKTNIRINGFLLPPVGLLADRFDLPAESTAYLADSAHTALYESRFRREVKSRSLSELIHLSMVQFVTRGTLRLADLRSLAEAYPVLQAQRFTITQAFALDCRQHKLDGILYESAQHPHHTCVVLFEAGIAKMKKVASEFLVTPDTYKLRTYVTEAARRSAVPLLDFPDQDTQMHRNLRITNIDWQAGLRAAAQAARQSTYQGEVLNFESPGHFFGQLTEKRWTLVRPAQSKGELSVRELARLVERDVKRVHEDVVVLADLGLLESTESGGVLYPYSSMHIDMVLKAA